EVTLVDGGSVNNADDGRFGDYSQMWVNPAGDTFWFTAEYAGEDQVETRIAAFQLEQVAFDLSGQAILSPMTSPNLAANELVSARFTNRGQNTLMNYEVGFLLNNELVQNVTIAEPLAAGADFDYQFSTPINLSAVGEYEIAAYIQHPKDENALNDTIRMTVKKLPALDGGISSMANAVSCKAEVPTTVTLTNSGGETITNATIDIAINGTNVDGINFTGSLPSNESVVLNYIATENLRMGENTIAFALRNINNSTDGITGNNFSRATFNLDALGEFITLVFNTDEYPEETTWTIINADTDEEIQAGGFGESQAESRITQDVCLDLGGCYVIIVEDSEGDGICCDFGEGDFTVLDATGQVLLFNDGEFGNDTEEEFCPSENECSLNVTITTENTTTNNSNDGSIMIMPTGGIAPYEYSIDNGENFQDSNIFANLPAGEYSILVSDDDGCELIRTIVIQLATSVYSINGQDVEVRIMPNPTQGVFQIVISNLRINTPLLDFSIYDINGKLIQQRKIGQYNQDFVGTLSLYDYPNGNYFLQIQQEGVNILERIVKVD
ncbi:MAG: T9SS type A sorting domain-containing protein, partial [Saprospiraceae bacterium]